MSVNTNRQSRDHVTHLAAEDQSGSMSRPTSIPGTLPRIPPMINIPVRETNPPVNLNRA